MGGDPGTFPVRFDVDAVGGSDIYHLDLPFNGPQHHVGLGQSHCFIGDPN